ncbi:MAG: hypothetical protein ACI9MC_001316 [Kiritimatiellia bacterium]|jgi:hypothetical protein
MFTKTALLLLLTCVATPTAWAGGESAVATISTDGDGFIWESTDDKNVTAPTPSAPTAPPTYGPSPTPMHLYNTTVFNAQQYWRWLFAHMMGMNRAQ